MLPRGDSISPPGYGEHCQSADDGVERRACDAGRWRRGRCATNAHGQSAVRHIRDVHDMVSWVKTFEWDRYCIVRLGSLWSFFDSNSSWNCANGKADSLPCPFPSFLVQREKSPQSQLQQRCDRGRKKGESFGGLTNFFFRDVTGRNGRKLGRWHTHTHLFYCPGESWRPKERLRSVRRERVCEQVRFSHWRKNKRTCIDEIVVTTAAIISIPANKIAEIQLLHMIILVTVRNFGLERTNITRIRLVMVTGEIIIAAIW